MNKLVNVEVSEHRIATITLNRPEAANAFSLQMLYDFHEILHDIKFNKEVSVVILTAAGASVFCAGADLKERATMDEQQVRRTVALIRSNVNDVENLPQPVICALNGSAFGGGLELALACDIRIAQTNALLGLTETSLAIIPGAGGTQRLPRLIGAGKAKELIYTARRINALEAERIGLVEYMVPIERLLDKAQKLALEMVGNGPLAMQQAKYAINNGLEVDLHTGLALEQKAYEVLIPTKDRIEGLTAFREKRKPNYKGE
ncbi:enoyl-CoA hydratase [Halalkalibacter nanhaiisediminis]|uniref:Enoyl-CoA hydratase/carnithine racemase n=1 Tax=Halalkalibacter nanhaiisediminis TaxID=688079 RepID=A0A562QCP3_9BACI|nr:enoyl-CoA hydratase [Halalkalibacter nanhaiisediminis]TWI54483.1 enoyl-CoA hydratase/carnithine racemase [Halalkalibacter nanhaiisediminis]